MQVKYELATTLYLIRIFIVRRNHIERYLFNVDHGGTGKRANNHGVHGRIADSTIGSHTDRREVEKLHVC